MEQRVLSSAVLLLVLWLGWPAATIAADDSDCAMCHEDVASAFQRTAHALAPGWGKTQGCQSCHGPGDAHIESGEADAIIRPQLQSPRDASNGCLSCHQREEKHFAGRGSLHGLNDVGCVDCHNAHSTATDLLREPGQALCASCHQEISARFEMPRSHPMGEGGPGCVSCHEPHSARKTHSRAGEDGTCSKCHATKAGPFLYNHDVSIVDGCVSCHDVHGSTNRHLLKHDSQVNLCYECHSGNLTPGWHSAARFTTEKCTACHSAIHGSNTSQFYLEE